MRRPAVLSGPLAGVHLASLVLGLGSGAWLTCWAIFFTRSVGLSATEFGVGVSVAGVFALVLGSPFGYLADRIGTREVLVFLSALQGLATLGYLLVSEFWLFLAVTFVVITAQRLAPGIRMAVISGLTTGTDRMSAISTNRVIQHVGLTAGSGIGAVILSVDAHAAYVTLIVLYAVANLGAAVLTLRVGHVPSLADRGVSRGMLVLRDRPFLVITSLSGVLALGWGMIDTGLPLWVNAHTGAPLWIVGVIVAGNALAIILWQNRVSRGNQTVADAARQALWCGVALAVSCLLFALTYHGSGVTVVVLLLVASAVHTVGELLFSASGWGLSVGLTPGEAHGEYQSTFAAGYATALTLSPALMTVFVVGWGVLGWLVLAVLFLLAALPVAPLSRWAEQTRPNLGVVR